MPLDDLTVTVGGDLSSLEATLNDVPAIAQQAGAAIDTALGSALDTATASLTNLSSSLQNVGAAASTSTAPVSELDAQLKALFDQGMSLGEAMAAMGTTIEAAATQGTAAVEDLNGQMNLFGQSTAAAAAGATQLAEQMALFDTQAMAGATGVGAMTQNLPNMREQEVAATESTLTFEGALATLGQGIASLSEGMMGLIEAFVIFEGLKEIATQALSAAAAEESAAVSMAHFTGSTEAANAAIDKLKKMAVDEALSLPQLLQAQVRMEALRLSTSQIDQVMQMTADASKTMGISFESASQRIDAMIVSGVLMTRSLTSMGVNAQALADTMGVATTGMTKAWKELTIDQRIADLNTAFASLGGQARAQAATIGGAYDSLKAQLYIIWAEIGEAIAPAVKGWADSFHTTLLPAVQEAVGAFASLPPEVRDLVVATGGLVAAFALLEGAIKLANIAGITFIDTLTLMGRAAVAGAVLMLVDSMNKWIQATNNADQSQDQLRAQLEKQTTALAAHGIVVVRERDNLEEWTASVIKGFSQLAATLPTIEQHNAGLDKLTAAYQKNKDAVDSAQATLTKAKAALDATKAGTDENVQATAIYDNALQALHKAQQAVDPTAYAAAHKELTAALKAHSETLAQLTQQYTAHAAAVQIAANTLQQAQAAYAAAQVSGHGLAQALGVLVDAQNQYMAALQKADPLMKSHAATAAEIGVQYEQAGLRVTASGIALEQAQAAYVAAKASGDGLSQALAVLITAQENYTKSLQAADPLLKLHVTSLQEMGVAYDQAQLKVGAAKTVLDAATESLKQIQTATGAVEVINGSLGSSYVLVGQNVTAAKGALDAANTSLDTMTAAHGNLTKALALVQQAQENYTAALRAADAMAKGHGASLDELKAKYDQNKLAVQQATETLKEAIAAEDGSAKMAEVVRMAQDNLTAATKTLDEGVKTVTASHNSHAASLSHVSAAARETVGTFGDYTIQLGATTAATRIHVQSLQEMDDHETALAAAIGIAKAQLDAAQKAYDGSGKSIAVVNAAQAQFNKLVTEAGPLVKDLTGDLGHLASGYDGVASAATGAGKAVMSLGQQLDASMGGMHGALYGVSGDLSLMQSMFGGYQQENPFSAITGAGATQHPGPGINAVIVNGEIVSESQITPGSLGPADNSAVTSTGIASALAPTVGAAVTVSLSTVADAAAILQSIAQNDFVAAIAALQKDGESMQNAFTDVMAAADAMRAGGLSLQSAAAGIAPTGAAPTSALSPYTTGAPSGETSGAPEVPTQAQRYQLGLQALQPVNDQLASFSSLMGAVNNALSSGNFTQALQLASNPALAASIPDTNALAAAREQAQLYSPAGISFGDAAIIQQQASEQTRSMGESITASMNDAIAAMDRQAQSAAYLAANPPPQTLSGPGFSFGGVTQSQLTDLNSSIGALGLTTAQANEALTTIAEHGGSIVDVLDQLHQAYGNSAAGLQAQEKAAVAEQQAQQQAADAYANTITMFSTGVGINLHTLQESTYGTATTFNALTAAGMAQIEETYRLAQQFADTGASAGWLSTELDQASNAIAKAANADLQAGNLASAEAKLGIGSLPGMTNLASLYPTTSPYAGITPTGSGISVTVVNSGTVVGTNGMQQLANTVGNTVVDQLRRAGLRF